MSCVVPSLNVPVAKNCSVLPRVTVGFAGVTAIELSVPVPTVTVVVPVTPEALAETVTLPPFFPCTRPDARTWAMFGLEDFQVKPLKFEDVLPSLNLPVAVSFSDVPFAMRGLAGVMVIETRCAVETVRPVSPLTEPTDAIIVVVPVARLLATPWLLMVTAAGLDEAHSAVAVTSWVLLSLKVPVAVNCLLVPTAMLEFAGVTAIETNVAAVTVSVALPLTSPEAAEMVATPAPTPLANPEESTEAVPVAVDDQVTDVSNCVLPSSKVPVAVNCWSVPCAMDATFGLTAIEISCAGTTVRVLVSLNAPTVAVIAVEPAATVVTNPLLSTVATDVEEEVHVTPLTKSCEDPLLYVAVAVNC